MTTWLEDASANRHIKTYVKDFLDLSGNMTVRQYNEDYKWNSYGQVLSGPYESDGAVYFGLTVDMDATCTTIAVGGSKDNTDGAAGVVRVYRYDSDAEVWYQLGNNLVGDSSIDTDFGWQGIFLSDDGTILAVNDYGSTSSSGLSQTGKIYVFQYNADTNNWDNYGDNQTELEGTSATQLLGDYGISMSGDGSTIAATERLNDHSVRIKKLVNGSWTSIGDTGVVGAANFDHARPSLNYDGSRVVFNDFSNQLAYVYDYSGSGTTWTQVGSAIPNSGGNGQSSYTSMNKAGDIIAIHEQTNETVRIYQFVDTDWVQLGSTLSNSYGSSGYFGEKMRLNAAGDMIIVGDYANDTINIFKYQNYDWVQIGDTLAGIAASDFGRGVAISDDGTKIVAGGWLADLNGTNSGYVQAFQWSQKSYEKPIMEVSGNTLTISNGEEYNARGYVFNKLGDTLTGSNDAFGYTVNMNYTGDMMIVGRNTSTSANAHPTVYKYRNGQWSQVGTNVYGENSTYFSMISLISNDGTVIAASSHTALDGSNEGAIHVYEFINGDWSLKGSAIQGSGSGAYFSIDGMELSGDGTVVAGVSRTNYAKVFKYVEDSTNDWVQMGSDFTINPASSALAVTISSRVIGLSDDGTIFAASSTGDDTTGTDNGKVEVYKFTGDVDTGSWNQLGSTIYGVARSGNTYEGMTLKLSADGTILAIGSWKYNSSNGYIRVFKYIEAAGDWCQMGADIQNDRATAGSWARGFDMSSDGKTLAVGDAGAKEGQVRNDEGGTHIFKYVNGQWVFVDHIASTYAVADTYLGKYVTISGDGKRFAAGSNTNPGIVEAWEITNPPFIKVDKDGASLDNLFTGDNVTLQCPTLKGVSGATANYESFWGRNPGLGDWRSSFGNQNAGYLYIDNAYSSAFDLLLTGFYTGGGGVHRRGHDLASRSGGALNFQTRITQGNTNEAFSLGVNATAYTNRLNVSGAAWSSGSYYSSDDRIKHNETPLTNALETIRKLNPQHYIKTIAMYDADHQLELDASGNPLDASGNPMPVSEYIREDGFIAQEVNEIPELKYTFVESDADDQPHGLDYTSIFTTAVKALKELDELDGERQTKLSSLQARIEALENE